MVHDKLSSHVATYRRDSPKSLFESAVLAVMSGALFAQAVASKYYPCGYDRKPLRQHNDRNLTEKISMMPVLSVKSKVHLAERLTTFISQFFGVYCVNGEAALPTSFRAVSKSVLH